MQKSFFILFFFLLQSFFCSAFVKFAKDSIPAAQSKMADSSHKKKAKVFIPRTATIRSAILPGLGQIYNRKYWKLPLVYGALGITASIFFYNLKNYKIFKQAYIYKTDTLSNEELIPAEYRAFTAGNLRSYRNSFRQNVDYSALFFLLFWGLNVVDATVDAHLKSFDVNDNLSLQIKQGFSPLANTNGVSLVLNIGKRYTALAKLP